VSARTTAVSKELSWVVFSLDDQRYALPLENVDHVVQRVAISRLPQAPEVISGMINVHGHLIPVINLRRRFRLPERPARLTDQFLLVHTERRSLALCVDAVQSVLPLSSSRLHHADTLLPGLEYLKGILRLPDEGLVLVNDLDAFLSLDEEVQLDAAQSAFKAE